MKKLVPLIVLVAFFTVSIFVFIPKPAFAYCVYNKTNSNIYGYDTRKKPDEDQSANRYWRNSINPGGKDCCPGNHKECQNATIHIDSTKTSNECEISVEAHGWIVVHSNDSGPEIHCNVNEPL